MSKRLVPASALFAALLLAGCASSNTEQTVEASATSSATASVASTPAPESTEVVGGERTPSGPQAVDDAFLTAWKTFFPNQSDGLAIAQALNICDSLKVGNTFDDQSQMLQTSSGVSSGDAGFLVFAATIAYCPEFSDSM